MPKSNLVRDHTKEKTLLFSSNIDKYMKFRKKKSDEVARYIGISSDTLRKKRKNPSTFKLPEIIRIVEYLDFSEADRAEIF